VAKSNLESPLAISTGFGYSPANLLHKTKKLVDVSRRQSPAHPHRLPDDFQEHDSSMEVYDLLMIAVLVGATVFGAWKGLAWQLASLGAIVASFFVAVRFRADVAEYIHTEPPWDVFIAMLILYVGTSLVIWIVFRMVSQFIDRLKLKEFDRQIGALFGLAKGVLLCVIVTLFAVTLLGDRQREAIVRSRSGYYIARLLDRSHAVMPREVHELLGPYMESFDEQVDHSGVARPGPAADDSEESPFTVPVDDLFQAWQPSESALQR
jgi:membrane protein required for colicin V production